MVGKHLAEPASDQRSVGQTDEERAVSEAMNLRQIEPGTVVIGVDGVVIGEVESVDETGIRVAGQTVPPAAIERVAPDGIHLHLARTAFEARIDPTV